MKVLAVGGGSGGHVTPVAAVLKELAQLQGDTQLQVRFVCDKGFLTQSRGIMKDLPFPVTIKTIPSGKLRRYAHFSWWHYLIHFSIVLQNIADIAKTAAGFVASLWQLIRFRPDVVFAKGGFVCLPMGYAARLLGVPVVIHDSDARPGLTNKLMARFAKAIGTGMPLENYSYNPAISQYVGVPINPAIVPTTPQLQREYRQSLQLPTDRQIVVAVGGGLGSTVINNAMIAAAAQFEADGAEVLFYNVTGVKNIEAVRSRAGGLSHYRAVPFVYQDMHKLLGAADVVVTRASATTLQELAGLAKAVVAVPAKQLGDQGKNAELFARYDAVVALGDDELADTLGSTLVGLLADTDRRQQLSANLHALAKPEAARAMAQMIREAAQ